MIIDTLDNLGLYVGLNPLLKEVVDFLKTNDWNKLEDGKHEIKGSDVFVNLQTVVGKARGETAMEWHKKMIDVQVPISATETYGYMPKAELPEMDYNEEKDMAKLLGTPTQMYVTAKPGQFVIFMPQDGHAPGICEEPNLRKAIFKVKA